MMKNIHKYVLLAILVSTSLQVQQVTMPVVNNVAAPIAAPARLAQKAKPAAKKAKAPAAGKAKPVLKKAAVSTKNATVDSGNVAATLIQDLTKKATTASELYKKARAAAAGLAAKMQAHQTYMTNGLNTITAQVNANIKESLALSAEINKDAGLPAVVAAAPAAKPAAPVAKKARRLKGAIKPKPAASYLVSAAEKEQLRRLVSKINTESKKRSNKQHPSDESTESSKSSASENSSDSDDKKKSDKKKRRMAAAKMKDLSSYFPTSSVAAKKRVLQKVGVKASPAVLKAAAKKVDAVLSAAKKIVNKDSKTTKEQGAKVATAAVVAGKQAANKIVKKLNQAKPADVSGILKQQFSVDNGNKILAGLKSAWTIAKTGLQQASKLKTAAMADLQKVNVNTSDFVKKMTATLTPIPNQVVPAAAPAAPVVKAAAKPAAKPAKKK